MRRISRVLFHVFFSLKKIVHWTLQALGYMHFKARFINDDKLFSSLLYSFDFLRVLHVIKSVLGDKFEIQIDVV